MLTTIFTMSKEAAAKENTIFLSIHSNNNNKILILLRTQYIVCVPSSFFFFCLFSLYFSLASLVLGVVVFCGYLNCWFQCFQTIEYALLRFFFSRFILVSFFLFLSSIHFCSVRLLALSYFHACMSVILCCCLNRIHLELLCPFFLFSPFFVSISYYVCLCF